GAAERRVEPPVLQVPRPQQVLDQPQEAVVMELLPQNPQQHRVVYTVVALRDVALDEPCCSPPRLLHCAERGMAAAPRTEAVGVLGELRLEVGLQDEADHLLQQLV